MDRYDLICIGSGPAGEKAASQAAYFKKRVAIVERSPRPGGAMVNTGTIPSKSLRETALLCSAFRRRPLPGMSCEFDHELSVVRFMARRHMIEQQEHDRIEASMDRHGIEIFRGIGHLEDPHTVVVEAADGTRRILKADHVLVATGSSPVRPVHIPFDHPAVVDADGVLELERLPASMVVVGGGVIGCEYSSIFAEIDVRVTLVHPRDAILPFIDAECRDHLVRAMTDVGIDLRLETTVDGVEPKGDGTVRVLTNNGPIDAEILLWAAGRSPNTRDLGLETLGVEMDDRGQVKVDDHGRTSVPFVYAAGDVIGFPALASTSMEQGRIAACDMFDLGFKSALAATIPIGIYTIPGVSMVGRTEAEARKTGQDVVTGTALYRYNVRGRMLGDETGIVKCVFDRATHALVGASIVGHSATELIHLAQAAIAHGDGISHFTDACYNYPSLTELYKYAAYDALQSMAHAEARADELGQARVA